MEKNSRKISLARLSTKPDKMAKNAKRKKKLWKQFGLEDCRLGIKGGFNIHFK